MKLYAARFVEWSHMPIYVLAETFDQALSLVQHHMTQAKPPIHLKELECLAAEHRPQVFVEIEAA